MEYNRRRMLPWRGMSARQTVGPICYRSQGNSRYGFNPPESYQQRPSYYATYLSSSYRPTNLTQPNSRYGFNPPESYQQSPSYCEPYLSSSYRPTNLSSRPRFSYIRRPKHIPSGNRFPKRPVCVSTVGFYSVKILPCKDFGRDLLMLYISSRLGKTILTYRTEFYHGQFRFFVNDFQTAKEIAYQDGEIYLPDGTLMRINVKPANPSFDMDDDMTQVINNVLYSKYNASVKAANLSSFQNNHIFTSKELICSLNLPSVLVHVTDVLINLAPDLVILSLNENSLTLLDEAGRALRRFRCLKVLHLSKNKIRNIEELAHLSALNLEVLDLRGNDLFRTFRFQDDYITEVRNMLPSLRILDGVFLPERIGFDLTESDFGSLPGWLPHHVPDNFADFAKEFLTQFYALYDEIGRRRLASAYHAEAVMSMICDVPTSEGVSYSMVSAYHPFNRNFLLPTTRDPLGHLLFCGPNQIAGYCEAFPPSLHIFETFSCDVLIFDHNLVQISVTGLFEELGGKPNVSGEPLKSFHRCFVLVRVGNGYLLINDSLVIRYPTTAQIQAARKRTAKLVSKPILEGARQTLPPTTIKTEPLNERIEPDSSLDS